MLGERVGLAAWQEDAVRSLLSGAGYQPGPPQPGGSGTSPSGHPHSALGIILSTAAQYERAWTYGTPIADDPRLEHAGQT